MTETTKRTTKVWAHRGASGYRPENTLEAFELAIRQGADGIELDVHTSADGELIVMHDENVDRVTDGTGLIKDMTLAQLKELKVGNSNSFLLSAGKLKRGFITFQLWQKYWSSCAPQI